MLDKICPKCARMGTLLDSLSSVARVNYYRCDCGHVWVREKGDLGAVPRDVTVTRQDKSSE